MLRYGGYSIEDLARHSSFLETAYLLIYGRLPTASQLNGFEDSIAERSELDARFDGFFTSFPRDAHPMTVLAASVSAMGALYFSSISAAEERDVEEATRWLLGKIPALAARCLRLSTGQEAVEADTGIGYVKNFLRMSFGKSAASYEVDPDVVRVLDALLILHADHEQNCSTSMVRLVGSSHADLFASVAAGINALSGPLHGGANQAVVDMLGGLHTRRTPVRDFLREVKDGHSGVRLMGFGHRVYKNYDPRASIVKTVAKDLLARLDRSDPLLDIALELENAALADD